jgi:hypothetical protein
MNEKRNTRETRRKASEQQQLAVRIGLLFIERMSLDEFLHIQKQTDHELLPELLRLIDKKSEVTGFTVKSLSKTHIIARTQETHSVMLSSRSEAATSEQ